MNESIRRDQRIDSLNSSIFSFSDNSEKLEQIIASKITKSIQLIMNNEIENKLEGMKLINECILSYQKYVVSMLSEKIIHEICSLTENSIGYTLSLDFLSILIEVDQNIYQLLLSWQFYEGLINSLNPSLGYQNCEALLKFICSSIKSIPESILVMKEFGLVDAIRSIDQNRFIQQLRFIYCSLLISTSDLSFLENILYYLSFPKAQLKIDTIQSVIDCIFHENILSVCYNVLLFDQRIIDDLSNQDISVVAKLINIYSLCCNVGDSVVTMLFENKQIIEQIFSYLLVEDDSVRLSVLSFFDSLVSNSISESNLENLYQLFIDLNLLDLIESEVLSYQAHFIVSRAYLKLCGNLSDSQLEPIINPLALQKSFDALDVDEEGKQICLIQIRKLFEKFSSNQTMISMLKTFVMENDSFEDLVDILNDFQTE